MLKRKKERFKREVKVLIDEKLSWRNHIHTVATNISQTIAMLTNEDILYIYNTLITPCLTSMSLFLREEPVKRILTK